MNRIGSCCGSRRQSPIGASMAPESAKGTRSRTGYETKLRVRNMVCVRVRNEHFNRKEKEPKPGIRMMLGQVKKQLCQGHE